MNAGITTVTQLASSPISEVKGIGSTTLSKLRDQAKLQVKAREAEGPPPYDLLPDASSGIGLGALPVPDAGDLFFDIEGDPYVGEGGLEYLLGVSWRDADGSMKYRAFWATTQAKEQKCFEEFVDFVIDRRAKYPGMHVYHYAAYEKSYYV